MVPDFASSVQRVLSRPKSGPRSQDSGMISEMETIDEYGSDVARESEKRR